MYTAQSEPRASSLDDLVASVATTLMGVNSTTVKDATGRALRTLIEYFEVDQTFLRFHDLARRATILVAECPPRTEIPDPDPLGFVYFDDADPVFAASEHLQDIAMVRPTSATVEYENGSGSDISSADFQDRVRTGAGVVPSSVVTVPLRAGDRTTGLLGFLKYGDRGWTDDELRALRTIALLFAQTEAAVAAEARLRHIAHHDELTGLPNRRAILAHLHDTMERRTEGTRALLFVDVDRLKAMNDFLGHEAGDRFIAGAAARLRESVGAEHLVGRLGGDEFVVVMDGPMDQAGAVELAERVQATMDEPVRLGGQMLGRTVSIGIAVATPRTTTVADWLRSADQAVLVAKERGGDTIATFTAEMAAREQVRVAVEMNLPTAIRHGLLELHYQPIVDLRTRTVLGAEALVRWNHPTLGPLPPELFVGVAEATNMAGELGEWVLDEGCRQLAAWRRTHPHLVGPDFTLSVNISPVQLIGLGFADCVSEVLARHGLTGGDLLLEVTEHAMVSDATAATVTMEGLRARGVAVAIDDFGTGYSSMEQLKTLPAGVLKIDKGFVRYLGCSNDDSAIVRSIIGLAESFHLDLIAEGVETESAAQRLLALGCTTAQGYLFSPAMAPHGLLELLSGALASAG